MAHNLDTRMVTSFVLVVHANTNLKLACLLSSIYIISEEGSIFAPQRLRFYKAMGAAACTVGKVRASTVFMCVCSTFRSSDFFLLFVKNGFVVGVRTLNVTAGH